MISWLMLLVMISLMMISILCDQAVVLCEEDSMCGGFTFKGVQLQQDTLHEVTVMMMIVMILMVMGATMNKVVMPSQIIGVPDLKETISNPIFAYFPLRIDQVFFFHLLFNLETDLASLHWTFYR